MNRKDSKGYASRQDGGASPLFSPVHGQEIQLAAAEVQSVLYRSPHLYDEPHNRWSLESLAHVVKWLRPLTPAGVCKVLRRLHVSYKRGQRHVHSPDLQYNSKLARLRVAFQCARERPDKVVFLYQDEHLAGRNATVARCFSPTSDPGLRAEQASTFNSMLRVIGCLNALTGAVIARRYASMNVDNFIRFLRWLEEQVDQQQKEIETIYLALDNWTVHVHDLVRADLLQRQSKIQLLFLPTYAPWTNPIEKVWLLFNQEVGDMHPYCTNWSEFRHNIDRWISQHASASTALLRRVGLLPDDPKYSLFYNPT